MLKVISYRDLQKEYKNRSKRMVKAWFADRKC
jgi:hypothetical protein